MALAPGTRLGPCEVLSPIGAGGMGSACGRCDGSPELMRSAKALSICVQIAGCRFIADWPVTTAN